MPLIGIALRKFKRCMSDLRVPCCVCDETKPWQVWYVSIYWAVGDKHQEDIVWFEHCEPALNFIWYLLRVGPDKLFVMEK